MSKFLVDENLPINISRWASEDFEFALTSFQSKSDSILWDYAKSNRLTIITKDSDFAFRIMTSIPPPKVIQINLGI